MNVDRWNELPLPRLFEALVPRDEIDEVIARARREDMGERGDITSTICIPPGLRGRGVVRVRQAGRLGGAALIEAIGRAYDPALRIEPLRRDGDMLEADAEIAAVSGNLRSVLAAERVMLNFLTHLSGIATLTAKYVAAVAETGARIYDTRKTVPGLRRLAKYAVRCGGGYCHRIGLYDAVLMKDNHLAAFDAGPLEQVLRQVLARVDAQANPAEGGAVADPAAGPAFVEVEVDTLDQLETVLGVEGIDIVLLDNMPPDTLRRAVALRDRLAPHVQLEASGGISLETVAEIARTGVERIAVGALTHSAPALDIALDVEPTDGARDA